MSTSSLYYVCLIAALGACLGTASAATGGKPASVGFNPRIQSSALLQDGAEAYFALKVPMESASMFHINTKALAGSERQLMQSGNITCPAGQKVCDNTGCIPQANTCCGDGNGASCPPDFPKCVNGTNQCNGAGNMAQAKIGMVLGSVVAVVVAMIMM